MYPCINRLHSHKQVVVTESGSIDGDDNSVVVAKQSSESTPMLEDGSVANDDTGTEVVDNSDDSVSEEDDVVLVQDVEADEEDVVIEQVHAVD